MFSVIDYDNDDQQSITDIMIINIKMINIMIINMITNFNMAKTSDLHYAQSFPKQQACPHTPGLPRTAGNEQMQIVFIFIIKLVQIKDKKEHMGYSRTK